MGCRLLGLPASACAQLAAQSYVFDSPSFLYVRAYYERERSLARSRRERAEEISRTERRAQGALADETRCARVGLGCAIAGCLESSGYELSWF